MSGFDPNAYGNGTSGNSAPYGDLSAPSKPSKVAKTPKPAASTQPTTTGTDVRTGAGVTKPNTFADELAKGFNSTISAGQAVLNSLLTPMYANEESVYQSIKAAKGSKTSPALSFITSAFGIDTPEAKGVKTSDVVNAATGWASGKEVKHTGGAIAKELGLTSKGKDFWSQAQNTIVGTAIDIALDPFTYTPAAPVFAIGKGVARAGEAVLKSSVEAVGGKVLASQAAKRLDEEALKAAEKTTKITPNTGIKPKNLVQPGQGKEFAQQVQDTYLTQFAKLNTKLVQLPKDVALDRTLGQKAADSLATSLSAGLNAFRQVLLTHSANEYLSKLAKAPTDYVYHAAEDIVQPEPGVVPKPNEIKIEAPKVADRSHVPFPEHAPTKFEATISDVGQKTAKEIKSTLSYVDNIAKRVVGVTPTSKALGESVFRVIQNMDKGSFKIFSALKPELQKSVHDAIKLNEYNPKVLFNELLARATGPEKDKVAEAFVNSYGNRILPFSKGRNTIGGFFRDNAAIPFDELAKSDRLNLVKALQNYTADNSAQLVEELSKTTNNPEITKQLIDAGALTVGGRAKNKDVIKKILDNLSASASGGEKIGYDNVEELINGIRSGHIVSGESLAKIIKKLDPQNSVIASLEKAGTKPSSQMMAEILKGDGVATQTLAQMRERINLANTEVFLSSTGVGMAKTVAAVLDAQILGKLELPPEIFAASREQAARSVAEMDGSTLSTLTSLLSDTFSERFGEAANILSRKEAHERTSDLGDHAIIGATMPYKGGEVILADQTGTAFSAKLSIKTLGLGTTELARSIKKTPGLAMEETLSAQKLDRFVTRMVLADETLLATTGARLFIQKERADVGADLANMHRVFLHLGDVVDKFRAVNDDGFIEKAMAPTGTENVKFDGFEVTSVLKTVRQVLEDRERKNPHDITTLIGILTRREAKNKISKTFEAEQDQLAVEFVRRLVSDVSPELEKVHLNRASAAVLDHAQRSMDLSEQIIGRLKDAWAVATKEGRATAEERFAELQDMFNRFAYSADIIRQTDGRIAEAVMRAASMIMVKGGKLATHGGEPLGDLYRIFPEKGTRDYEDMWEIINTYARKDDPMLGAPVGREKLPKPSPDVVAKVSADMKKAMDAVEKHIEKSQNLASKEALAEWRKESTVLAKNLTKVRNKAWYAWLPITHWSNKLGRWVPANQYNHAAELVWAKQHPAVLVGDELVKIAEEVVDTAPKALEGAGDGAVVAATKAAKNKAVRKRQAQLAEALAEDEAQKVVERAAEFDALGLPPEETAIRMQDEAAFQRFDATRPKVDLPNVFAYSMKDSKFVERWSQFGGRKDVSGYLQNAQALVHTYRSDLARAMHKIAAKFQGISQEDFSLVFDAALKNLPVDQSLSPELQDFSLVMNSVISKMMKDAELNSIDSNMLKNALKIYGLNDKLGFRLEGSLSETLAKVPFGKNPYEPGTGQYLEWTDRRKAFLKSGLDPMMALVKIGSAIQHVKSLQALAGSLVADVGYKAYGMTYEQAIKAGFVKLSTKRGSESELLSVMASPEEGALFHPNIARQIASLDREWTALLEKGKFPKVVGTIMDMTSYLKFSQTSINPRHHVTNLLGEMSAELLRGNLNVKYWKDALDIASEFGRQVFKSDYSKDPLYDAMQRALVHMDDPADLEKVIERYTKNGARTVEISVGGKTKVYSLAELAKEMSHRTIATSGIFSDEVTGLFEHLLLDNSSGSKRSLMKSTLTRLQVGMEKVMKPIGDATAVYTNVPRIAGALRVMEGRSWKSESEMWNAVAQDVHLYHPSIASLASGERKWGRLMVGYYTWLRVAHSAFIDMAVNHTAGVTMMPKVFSNVRQQQGIQQTSPGTPWGQDSGSVPQNLQGSVYGPVFMSDRGPMGIKTSALPMDVLENWNWYSDPLLNTRDPWEVEGKNWEASWKFLLGSSNPIVKQIAQEAFGIDFQTNSKIYDRSFPAIVDRIFQIIGPYQALKGAGIATPMGKETQTTPEKRQQALFNWLTGLKSFYPLDPGIQKAGKVEDTARIKAWQNAILKDQGK